MLDSLSKALELGYKPANIICMQGPFSELLNIEMMRKYNSIYLVTKDSGSIGGFEEKAQAAAKAGAKLIVIARNGEEFGTGYSEIVNSCNVLLPVVRNILPSVWLNNSTASLKS